MGEKGIFACKVEEITRRAGVAKGTFFTYFGSKEAFLARLVDQVLDDLARRVRPVALAPSEAESLMAGVGAVHLRYFQLRPAAAGLLCQVCSPDLGEPAAGEMAQRLGQHLQMVGEMLAPAAEQMGWPGQRAGELALMILATSIGYFWLGRPLALGQDTPAALLDRLGRSLARGLAIGGAGGGPRPRSA